MKLISHRTIQWAVIAFLFIGLAGCQKHLKENEEEILSSSNHGHGNDEDARNYSSKVIREWMNVQLRIMQSAPPGVGLFNSRYIGYNGVAVYEAIVPGMQGYQSLAGQLNGLGALPHIQNDKKYHWPSAANTALATMNRSFYTTASPYFKGLIDSLENAFNTQFQAEVGMQTFTRSSNFGKAIAQAIFAWSTTDGSAGPFPAYVPPVGPGLWQPTPPAFAPAVGPYYGTTRTFVLGSLNGSVPVPPSPYSADPTSAYYLREKEVYDISQTLTPQQTAQALYYRDNPGFQGGGGAYLSLLYQLLQIERPRLDEAAYDFALTGIGLADAIIGCWKAKYDPIFNDERPIRYIRTELGHPAWNPLFATPPHPDVPSGHSTGAGAMEIVFNKLFGKHYQFTNHAYDTLGMPPQVYANFGDMAKQIGDSRVFAGIHTRYACIVGREQGNKIASNIIKRLKFKGHQGHNDHWEDDDDD